MKRIILACSLWLGLLVTANAGDIAVRAGTLYTSAGQPIENGVVIIRDGKISAVGPASSVRIPDGMRVVEASVVTPGVIDAHTVVGLAGAMNQSQDQDQIEHSEALQPELRAIDAYNPREMLVTWLRDFGITTIHTGHGPGEVISGQTMIVKTAGDSLDASIIVPSSMIATTLGDAALVEADGGRKSPGTRGKAAAMLRSELLAAQGYAARLAKAQRDKDSDAPDRDLRKDALVRVLDGDMPLLVTAQRHQDILTALRIAEEFEIRIVLDGAAESYLLLDEIKAAGVPVILHPTMARATGDRENLSMTTAATLHDAGIPFAFQSGFEAYVPKTRVVLFEAATTLAHGMTFTAVLDAITIDAATLLGIEQRVGSIEEGKDGDLALFDGDPFEYTTHATGTIIDVVLVSDTSR